MRNIPSGVQIAKKSVKLHLLLGHNIALQHAQTQALESEEWWRVNAAGVEFSCGCDPNSRLRTENKSQTLASSCTPKNTERRVSWMGGSFILNIKLMLMAKKVVLILQ